MALVHRDIPGLYNGVSRQSAPLRLANQLSEQLNMTSSVVNGLSKRQGTRHLSTLEFSYVNENSMVFPFRDSEGRDYLVCFTGNSGNPIEVWLLGDTVKKCLVRMYDSGYLSGVSVPRSEVRCASISDYIVVVNRNKVCAMSQSASDRSPDSVPYALCWVKRGLTSTTYSLGGASYTTDSSTSTTNFSTRSIAEQLASRVQGASLISDSVIRITGTRDYINGLSCSDSYGNQAMTLTKGVANKEEDLPPMAAGGDVVEITGEKADTLTGYYVKFNWASQLWEECTGPSLYNAFDASTMPHQLIRVNETTFDFRPSVRDDGANRPGWEPRTSGDEISAPNPSFIGNRISDVFYHKNRLGFLSGQNLILSCPNDYFNFFPASATTTLDTDPTDRSIGFNEPVYPEFAVPYKEDLLLFSRNRQFIVSSGTEIFTAETAMIDLMSEYPCSTVVRPLNLESSLVFLSDVTGSTLVREYFIQADSMQCSAADITAHVPGYLPNNMAQAVALPNNTMLLLFSPSSPGDLSVYRYFWSGNEKPQSSWSRFSFPFRILAIAEFDEIVYFLGRFSDTGSVELFRFDPSGEDEWLMDSAFNPSLLSYDAERDCTSLTFPLDIPPDYPVKVVHTLDDGSCYSSFTEISRTSRMLTVAGDLSTGEVLLGIPFESSFELSELLLSSDGNSGMLQGRLQLRTLLLSFTDTGNFRIEVSYPGRETMIHNYTGVVLGEAVMAGRSLRSERRRFAVLGNAANLRIKIINDGILPSTFDSLSFEGIYHVRSQRT